MRIKRWCVFFVLAVIVSTHECFADHMGTNSVQVPPSINIGPFIGQETAKGKQEATCEWLVPTIDFVKNLLWPVLLAAIVFYFRADIRAKLRQLQSAETPAGKFSFLNSMASDGKALQNQELDQAIRAFVLAVTKDFLRTSSWNGLKLLFLCSECCKKGVAFDLKYVCAFSGSMSYDYALGYLVATCSARFIQYQTQDNVTILVTQVFEDVQTGITPEIENRLKPLPPQLANDFKAQLANISLYVGALKAP